MRLAAVRVFVTDLARSSAWYEVLLDAPPTAGGSDTGFAVFDVGCDLVIEPADADDEAEDGPLVGRFTGVSFAVDDIHAALGHLPAGTEVTGPPERQTWGGVLATIADPDGNRLQLVQYPTA